VRIIENGITGTEMPGAWHMTRREMMQTAAFVRTLGKVDIKPVPAIPRTKGSVRKLACSNCPHRERGLTLRGGFSGPDLSSIGLRRSGAHLREAIVDPGASLPENMAHTTIVLKSGKSLRGFKLNEMLFRLCSATSWAATR
jgi:hypothetical protein